jgi:hypothetical protein
MKLEFYTPEEYFLEHNPAPFEWGSINPLEILKKFDDNTKNKQNKYHKTVNFTPSYYKNCSFN